MQVKNERKNESKSEKIDYAPTSLQLDPKTGKADKAKNAKNAEGREGVKTSFSPESAQMTEAYNRAYAIAKATPDVREERIAALKAQIESGDYKIDSGKIADGIVREAILEHLATST